MTVDEPFLRNVFYFLEIFFFAKFETKKSPERELRGMRSFLVNRFVAFIAFEDVRAVSSQFLRPAFVAGICQEYAMAIEASRSVFTGPARAGLKTGFRHCVT